MTSSAQTSDVDVADVRTLSRVSKAMLHAVYINFVAVGRSNLPLTNTLVYAERISKKTMEFDFCRRVQTSMYVI